MRKKLGVVLLVSMMLMGCMPQKNTSYQRMSMEEAMDSRDEQVVVVDVRTPEEYESGHITGAINLPLDEIQKGNVDVLEDLDQTYYIYCRSGNRSQDASAKLVSLGYRQIVEIGGIQSYTGDIE